MSKLRVIITVILLLAMTTFMSSAEGGKLNVNMADSFSLGEYIVGEVAVNDSNSPTDKIVTCKIVSLDGSKLLNVEEIKLTSNSQSFRLGYPSQTVAGRYYIEFYYGGESLKKEFNLTAADTRSLKISMSNNFKVGDKLKGNIILDGFDKTDIKVVTYKIMDEAKSKILNIGEFKFDGNSYGFEVGYPSSTVPGNYEMTAGLNGFTDTHKFELKEKTSNNNGGSSSGGTSSNGKEDKADNTANSSNVVIKDEIVPKGLDEKASASAADKVKDSLKDLSFAKGTDSVKEVLNSIKSAVASNQYSNENIGQVMKSSNEMVIKLISKKDATYEGSKDIVDDLIKTNASNISSNQSMKKDLVNIKKDILTMADKTLKLAGKVEANNVSVDSSGNTVVKFDKDQVLKAIEKSIKSGLEMKGSIAQISSDMAAKLNPAVTLNIGAASSDKPLEVTIGEELGVFNNNIDLEVAADDIKFVIPKNLISKKKELKVSIKHADKNIKDQISKSADKYKSTGVVLDLDVKANGNETINPVVEIEVSQLEINGYDLDKLGIFIFNEESKTFEPVKSKLVDGKLVFTAPHFSIYTVMESGVKFNDMNGHWAKETVEKLAAKGIISGNPNGDFAPDADITRAEFISILVNALGLEGNAKSNFADVESSAWYYKNIGLASKYSLTNGDGAGNFNPNAKISRQDMAVMISRAFKIANSEELIGDAVQFTDRNKIASYAVSAVEGAKYHGIISGYNDGTFGPQKNATRAEAAKMVLNFIKY